MSARSYRTKKRFGQHFLHDPSVIQRMIYAINPKTNQKIIEIGPGLGALTFPLLAHINHLDVVEIDRDVVQRLNNRQEEKLTIHNVDALRFDFSQFLGKTSQDSETKPQTLRIIGNLPYNISTPLLFHLLKFRHIITDMHFMLQKEVVDRLVAEPGNKNYGRLSIMAQYYCDTEYLFYVAPTSFSPPPKVDSAVLRITPWQELPHVSQDTDFLSKIVVEAFSKRRKTLRNALKKYFNLEQLESVGIDPKLRPEQLSIAEFVALSNLPH
jgi:16S rRNA (adenine1518-N6/adenine1519-N6)-dimethyltransferase